MEANPDEGGDAIDVAEVGSYPEGTEVSIKAEANSGWEFINWTADPAVVFDDDEAEETTFTMPAEEVTVTANFGFEGRALHLDADAIANPLNGNKLETWYDISGNGFDAVQADPDNQPEYVSDELNGRPIVRFDGDSMTSDGSTIVQPLTIVFVLKDTKTFVSGAYSDFFKTTGTDVFEVISAWSGSANAQRWQMKTDGTDKRVIYTDPDNDWHIFTTIWDTDTGYFYLDGEQVVSDDINNHALELLRIGSGEFDLAEVIVFDRELSEDDRGVVEDFLSDKWGIPLQ